MTSIRRQALGSCSGTKAEQESVHSDISISISVHREPPAATAVENGSDRKSQTMTLF